MTVSSLEEFLLGLRDGLQAKLQTVYGDEDYDNDEDYDDEQWRIPCNNYLSIIKQ